MKTRKYLTMLLSLFSVLPILFIVLDGVFFYKQYALGEIQTRLKSIAELNTRNVEQFYLQEKTILQLTADIPQVESLLEASNYGNGAENLEQTRKSVNGIFQNAAGEVGRQVRRCILVNRYGRVIAADDGALIGVSVNQNNALRPDRLADFYVSDIQQDPSFNGGGKYFNISLPIYRSGGYQGYLMVSVDVSCFNAVFSGKIGSTGKTLLFDSNNILASDGFENSAGQKVDYLFQMSEDLALYKNFSRIDSAENPVGFLHYTENGVKKSGCYIRVPSTDWIVFSEVPQAEMMAPVETVLLCLLPGILLLSVLLVYSSNVAARRFLTPMRALTTAFVRLKQHDYTVRLPDGYKGEFGEIAASFNRLAERIGTDTESLKVSEARYALMMEETNQVIFEWDILENHLYHTVHWINKFGFGISVENPGKQIPNFSPAHPEDREKLAAFFEAARIGMQLNPLDVRMKTIDSKYIWCTVSLKVIRDAAGVPFRAIGLISDNDHRKKMMDRLENRTKMDLLTQLYNKMTAQSMMKDFLNSASPEQIHGFIILDIDNFKGINDTLGHIYGDNVLREVSARLRNLFRASDIVGRAGGDEFVILMKDLPDRAALRERLGEICAALRQICFGEGGEYEVSASVGAALFPADGRSFEELYQRADAALYRSKKAGKDRFCLYSDADSRKTC